MRVDSRQAFARQNVMFACSLAARTKKNKDKIIGIMSSLMDRTGSSTGGASEHKLATQTPTTSINKWSQRHQHKQQQQQQQHSRKRMMMGRHQQQDRNKCPPGAASLLLSLSIGLALAAIHSSAFANGPNSRTAAQHPQQPAGVPSPTGSSHFVSASSYRASQPSTSAAAAEQGSSSASSNLNESPAINLIPIDQPLNSNGGAETPAAAVTPAPASPGTSPASAHLRLKDSYDGSSLQLRSSSATGSSSDPTSASSSSLAHSLGGASSSQSAAGESNNDELNQSSQQQQQQQQQQQHSAKGDDFGSEPIGQYYASSNPNEPNGPAEVAYQAIMEQQPADGVKQQQQQQQQQQQEVVSPVAAKSNLVSPRPSVERRFGLFKKGQHQPQQHYGAPAMSANYAAGPFMTHCERCLAGFGQQTADLQQLEPAPLPPVSVTQPAPMGHFPIAQPFAPFKSKLFMKFPFLVKPSFEGLHSSGAGYGGGGMHYWPLPTQTYQPPQPQQQPSIRPSPSAMNQALYIRPASAYNCIQASPPLLAATGQAEVIPLTGPATKSGHSLASAKQQQHFMHHQQQVQSGYAK